MKTLAPARGASCAVTRPVRSGRSGAGAAVSSNAARPRMLMVGALPSRLFPNDPATSASILDPLQPLHGIERDARLFLAGRHLYLRRDPDLLVGLPASEDKECKLPAWQSLQVE